MGLASLDIETVKDLEEGNIIPTFEDYFQTRLGRFCDFGSPEVTRCSNSAVLWCFFWQQTNFIDFFLEEIERNQTCSGNEVWSKLGKRIESPGPIQMKGKNQALDDDALLNKGLLVVDSELRSQ